MPVPVFLAASVIVERQVRMEKSNQAVKKRGGKRPGAGRPPSPVKRVHRSIWASEEEYRKVMEFLFQSRQNDPVEL